VTYSGDLGTQGVNDVEELVNQTVTEIVDQLSGVDEGDVVGTSVTSGSIVVTTRFSQTSVSVNDATTVASNISNMPLVINTSTGATFTSSHAKVVVPSGGLPSDAPTAAPTVSPTHDLNAGSDGSKSGLSGLSDGSYVGLALGFLVVAAIICAVVLRCADGRKKRGRHDIVTTSSKTPSGKVSDADSLSQATPEITQWDSATNGSWEDDLDDAVPPGGIRISRPPVRRELTYHVDKPSAGWFDSNHYKAVNVIAKSEC